MTVAELIKELKKYPKEAQVKVFDRRKNLQNDVGDGSSSGIYNFEINMDVLDEEEKEFYKEHHNKDYIPFVELSFENQDYDEIDYDQLL